MAMNNYACLRGSADLPQAIASFKDPDARQRHADFVRAARQKEAGSNATVGWIMAVLGVVSVVGGLLAGIGILVLGGPFLTVFGIVVALRAARRSRAAASAMDETCESPRAACEKFYKAMLVRPYSGGTGATGEETLLSVAHLFPMPILEIYGAGGWDMFSPPGDSKRTNPGDLNDIECVKCGRRLAGVRKHFNDTLLYGKPATKDQQDKVMRDFDDKYFVRCRHCSSSYCLDDVCYNLDVAARYVCPKCAGARGGWKGLAGRWKACQERLFGASRQAPEVSLEVREHVSGAQATELVVTAVLPSGATVVFHNTAVRDDHAWYLLSPEPGMVD